jgi:hypothetical protein
LAWPKAKEFNQMMFFKKLFGRKQENDGGPRQIESPVAGTMARDKQLKEYWTGAPVAVPFFIDQMLAVTYSGYTPGGQPDLLGDYDAALASFLKLGAKHRSAATPHVHKNRTDYIAHVDWDGREQLRDATGLPESVWNFVTPREIIVTRRLYNDMDIYVEVDCDCTWEEEHGLALVFRQGKRLTRVSAIDGHLTDADANNMPDEEDPLLSAWKE